MRGLCVLTALTFLVLGVLVVVILTKKHTDRDCLLQKQSDPWLWVNVPDKTDFFVVTVCTPNYDKKGAYGVNSLALYCKTHNYGFAVYRNRIDSGLHVNFTKNQAIVELMQLIPPEQARYVVNIDADVAVHELWRPLSTLIDSKTVASMNAPRDNFIKRNVTLSLMNAGFIIWKNSKRAADINNLWMELARTKCKEQAKKHPRQQNVFDKCVYPKLVSGDFAFVDHNLVGMVYSSFISQHEGLNQSWRKLGSPSEPLEVYHT